MSSARRVDRDSRGQSIERHIVAIAERQHAIIHRAQLLAIGLSAGAIDRLRRVLESG
jgi:hypothetical protein